MNDKIVTVGDIVVIRDKWNKLCLHDRKAFHIFLKTRTHATIKARMRLNHGSLPAHLSRIGVNISAICTCDGKSVADVNHILLACKKSPLAKEAN